MRDWGERARSRRRNSLRLARHSALAQLRNKGLNSLSFQLFIADVPHSGTAVIRHGQKVTILILWFQDVPITKQSQFKLDSASRLAVFFSVQSSSDFWHEFNQLQVTGSFNCFPTNLGALVSHASLNNRSHDISVGLFSQAAERTESSMCLWVLRHL